MSKTPNTNSKDTQIRCSPKRIDKTLEWLEKSRDVWKDKCVVAKLDLKKKTLSVKRLRDGRDEWKYRAQQAAMTAQKMKSEQEALLLEIGQLKQELSRKNNELEKLKKKS
jgi:hypothetical protein